MPQSKGRIVFFGNERLATGLSTSAPTLRALLANGYEIAAVVSHQSESKASRKARDLEIAGVALEHEIPLLLPEKPGEIIDELTAYQAGIGVLVAYGKIVPQSVIDVFPHGIINIHPSLLPLHRGPIPIESVILDGSSETGVSVMQLVRSMDAGPVYGQHTRQLSGTETKQELADNLLQAGGDLVIDLLPAILNASLQPTPQDETKATYDELITKADSVLDFSKPAAQLEREVRAYAGWPGNRATIGGRDVVVTSAHTIPTNGTAASTPGTLWRDGKRFGFYTSKGIFAIDKLKPAGKQEMSSEAFLAGYPL